MNRSYKLWHRAYSKSESIPGSASAQLFVAITGPAWATGSLKKADSLELKVRAMLAERDQWIGYERVLAAAVDACE
ncbi:hypothetical protein [Pseudomonas sp. PH1b]|uniref:hypothetical protein n=1 Tax=Pseudomonas sp. PH1b TaxID=1397282 RepID=UPI00046A7547|nr:hypothetical protein [Pseudomonas sp. PH1b]